LEFEEDHVVLAEDSLTVFYTDDEGSDWELEYALEYPRLE
jgi:hypothetical protein